MQAKTAPSIAILLDIVAPPVADDAVTLCDNWSSSSKPRLCQSGFNIQLLDASGKSAMAARDITAAGTETAETPSIGGANLVGTESVGTESVVPTSAISSNATQQTSTAASLLTLQTTSTVSGVFGESAPPVLVPTTTVTSVFREVAPPTDAGVGQAETETVSKEVGTETAEIITNVVLGAAIGALYSATPSSESTTSQSTSSVFVDVAGQDLASVGPSLTISSVAKPVLDVWVLAVLDLSVAIIFV
ncbi:hypothetical protein BJ741DRAFT_672236 [Chytriomyces cf. hyalinus JEL632]|nr:hypothetical protein BJ741DRAFT_672236 [Chytriomyces cf. hyalinus JEL632]